MNGERRRRIITLESVDLAQAIAQDGVYSRLRRSETWRVGKLQVAEGIANLLQSHMDGAFDRNLSFFEKWLGPGKSKVVAHRQRVGLMRVGVVGAVVALPDLAAFYLQQRNNKELWCRYVRALGYCRDGEPVTALDANDARALAQHLGLSVRSHDSFQREFEFGAEGDRFKNLWFDTSTSDDVGRAMLCRLYSRINLKHSATKARAGELATSLGYASGDVDDLILDSITSYEPVRDAQLVAGLSLMTVFSGLFSDYEEAEALGMYALQHDPYEEVRNENVAKVKSMAKKGALLGLGALTLVTGPVGDVLTVFAAPLVVKLLSSSSYDPDALVDVNRTVRRAKKRLAKEMDESGNSE